MTNTAPSSLFSLSNAGGVAFYTSSSLIFEKIEKLSIANAVYESLFLQIKIEKGISDWCNLWTPIKLNSTISK